MTESSTTNLLHSICAGAALRFYKLCPRCGASVHEYCRDDAACQAQADTRRKVEVGDV